MKFIKRNCTDFDDLFRIFFKFSKLVGLRLKVDESIDQNRMWSLLNKVYSAFCVSALLIYLVLNILSLILLQPAFQDKFELSVIITGTVEVLLKILFIYLNYEKYLRILKDLKSYFDPQRMKENPDDQYLNKYTRPIFLYGIMQGTVAFFSSVIPIITTFINYFITTKWIGLMPDRLWYPFNPANYYIPLYAAETFMRCCFLILLSAGDCILLLILANINQQFQQLRDDFAELKDGSQVKKLVERHCRLYE